MKYLGPQLTGLISPGVAPESVSVTPNPASVAAGQTVQLVPTVLPSNAADKSVTYASRNPGIATVNASGLVAGVSAGNYTIDITTSNGVKTTVTGTVTAAVAMLKAVGRWNPMNDGVVTAAAGLTTYYVPVKMITGSGDATGLQLNFPAWYTPNTNTGMGTDLGNDINILEASLQTATTSAPVTFSGARTGVVPNGGNLISDVVTPEALGFTGGVIPVGTVLFMKMKATIPSGGKIPTSPRNLYGQSNLSGWFYNSANTVVPSVDALTNSTSGYTGTKPADAGNLYAPLLLGTYKDPTVKAVAGWGDSIESGYNDLSPGYLGGGFFQRALALFPVPAASINFGISGAKSPSLSTDPRILAYMKYVPDGLHIMVGTNDFGISTPPAASAIIANIDTMIARYKSAPGVKAGVKASVSRLLPRTTSTDQFATEANQSINANWNPGEVVWQFNALITTSKYDAIVVNDIVRGADVSKWAVNGTAQWQTQDGTHPGGNAGGAPLLASTYWTALQAAWA
jgi:lysophospholipase L1-like esterase